MIEGTNVGKEVGHVDGNEEGVNVGHVDGNQEGAEDTKLNERFHF